MRNLVPEYPVGWVSNVGFREVDLDTGRVNLEWWSSGKISPAESNVPIDDGIKGPFPKQWNWFHPNSIDKSAEGDYMSALIPYSLRLLLYANRVLIISIRSLC